MGVSRAISIEPAADEPAQGEATTPRWHGALAGFLSAAVALGVAQLVAGLVRGTTSPVVSVGEWVIDHVPVWVKEFAIRQFGTNDKPMLIAGTVVLLAVFAVVIGILAVKRLWIGVAGIALFGLMGMATAATRPDRVVPGRRAGSRRHARRRRHAGAPAPRHPPPDTPGAQRGSHPRRSTASSSSARPPSAPWPRRPGASAGRSRGGSTSAAARAAVVLPDPCVGRAGPPGRRRARPCGPDPLRHPQPRLLSGRHRADPAPGRPRHLVAST